MNKVYLLTILILVSIMSYEFWFFEQHYAALMQDLETIKKTCKVLNEVEIEHCTDDKCELVR